MGTLYEVDSATGVVTMESDKQGASYFKAEKLLTGTPVAISADANNQIVTGFTYTIPTAADGDYIIHAAMTVDAGGTDNKPFGIMLAKNGVVIANSITGDFMKKNEQQSIQITYPVDGLVATDVIAVYCNNDNLACDILLGRMLIQSWA